MSVISIAIPTFNRSSYLKQSLSVIQEEIKDILFDIEIVISDNCSSDDTEKVVNLFKGISIHYHKNERNIGPSENLLLACKLSKGEYILLMSDDDVICPGVLSRIIDLLKRNPQYGTITGPLEIFINEKSSEIVRVGFPSTGIDKTLDQGSEAFSYLFLRGCSMSGLIIRRNLLDIHGARKHIESLYPQAYLFGKALKTADALYLARPIARCRINPVKNWDYTTDFMAESFLNILKELTHNEPWCKEVRQVITRKRIIASYGPLYISRGNSLSSFFKIVKGLSSVYEYRNSIIFWGMVFGIGILSHPGIRLLKKFIPQRPSPFG